MKRILYIADNCHQCDMVSDWVRNNTDIAIINLDHDEHDPPISIFIFPALFENNELKAYGEDIIGALKTD